MSDSRKLADLSRQELYDLIWASPATKVAAEFGISNVGVRKHCIKKQVSWPTRGYWAKQAAGHKPRKKPLPPTAEEVFEIEAQRSLPKTLALPEPNTQLHPIASELLVALNKTKLRDHKQVRLESPNFPYVTVSKPLVERAAQSFHVILQALEPLGILFQKFKGTYDPGYFKLGHDRLFFHIDETLWDRLGSEQRRVKYWHWDNGDTPSGHLAFSCETLRYKKGEEMEWMETKKHSLERVLSEVVSAIRLHFLNKQRQRIQDAIDRKRWMEEEKIRHREWLAEEVIRKQKAAEKAHADAIHAVVEAREQDLIKASEWWRRSCRITNYIEECERRWKSADGKLSSKQSSWLAWAKAIADGMSPFTDDYPDPAEHGAFDPATIPFGGPYPAARN